MKCGSRAEKYFCGSLSELRSWQVDDLHAKCTGRDIFVRVDFWLNNPTHCSSALEYRGKGNSWMYSTYFRHWGVSNYWQLYCFLNGLPRLSTNKTPKLHITDSLWGQYIHGFMNIYILNFIWRCVSHLVYIALISQGLPFPDDPLFSNVCVSRCVFQYVVD